MAIIVQAVVMMNLFNHNFTPPIPKDEPVAFQTIGEVLLIDYVLNNLALGGVDQVILFSCQDDEKMKDYISDRVSNKAVWSLTMDVQVMMSETCQTMGDVMREIDAADIIRGHFILTGINTITNINFATLLEQHMQLYEKDKDAAMTLVYKKANWEHPLITSDSITFLAADGHTNKVLFHQKYNKLSKDKTINLPLKIILNNPGVKQHRYLIDTDITLCSPSVLHLFRENLEFQTRDDFIHALLVNEQKFASTLYYTLVNIGEYADAIPDWKNYELIRFCTLKGDVFFGEKSIIRDNAITTDSVIGVNSKMGTGNVITDSVIGADTNIGNNNVFIGSNIGRSCEIGNNNVFTDSVIGINCNIGNDNVFTASLIMNNVIVQHNCVISNSFIGNNHLIGDNTVISGQTFPFNVNKNGGSNMNIKQGSDDKDSDRGLFESKLFLFDKFIGRK